MGKYLRISSYIRKPLLIYDNVQLLHSESLYIWGKFDFLFYQCTVWWSVPGRDVWSRLSPRPGRGSECGPSTRPGGRSRCRRTGRVGWPPPWSSPPRTAAYSPPPRRSTASAGAASSAGRTETKTTVKFCLLVSQIWAGIFKQSIWGLETEEE